MQHRRGWRMSKSKRDIVLAALHAYADPHDPDGPNCGHEVVENCVEFFETFAGLDLESCSTPAGKTYDYGWILATLKQMYGQEAPAHLPIQFVIELGLVKTELINFEEEEAAT